MDGPTKLHATHKLSQTPQTWTAKKHLILATAIQPHHKLRSRSSNETSTYSTDGWVVRTKKDETTGHHTEYIGPSISEAEATADQP